MGKFLSPQPVYSACERIAVVSTDKVPDYPGEHLKGPISEKTFPLNHSCAPKTKIQSLREQVATSLKGKPRHFISYDEHTVAAQ